MSEVLVEINGLTKFYKRCLEPAVDGISLQVMEGEIFGLLGPNGAGKTTTLSVLCGLLKPTQGQIKIANLELRHHYPEIKKLIGVVSQNIALYEKLTAYENLYYFGRLYNINKKKLNARIKELLERLGLEKYMNSRIQTFSGGMKRRINLLAGTLHEPRLLFLDEPTSGVDVHSRNVIREYLFELKERNTTMLYTSHLMDDAQKLCTRVAILDYGKIITIGRPEDLINDNPDCYSLEDVFLKLTGRKLRDE